MIYNFMKCTALLLLSLVITSHVLAQNTISGKVTDENDNPLSIYHARSYENAVGDPAVVPKTDKRPLEEIKADPLYDPNRHARMMDVKFDSNGKPIFEYY